MKFNNYLKLFLKEHGVTFTDPCNGTVYNPINPGGTRSVVTDVGDGTYVHFDGDSLNTTIDTRANSNFYDSSGNILTTNNVQDAITEILSLIIPVTASLGVSHTTTTSTNVQLDFTNLPINADPVDNNWIFTVYNGANHVTLPLSAIITTGTNDSDWFVSNTSTAPTSINNNIYTMGFVGINKNVPAAYLDIQSTGTSNLITAEGNGANQHFRVLNNGTIQSSHEQNIHITDETVVVTAQGLFNINIGTNGGIFFTTQGNRNITMGAQVAQSGTINDNNILIGVAAGSNSTIGSNNVFIGSNTADDSPHLSGSNVAIGKSSLFRSVNSGSSSVIGQMTLGQSLLGLGTSAIGNRAGHYANGYQNNTFLGTGSNISKDNGTVMTITGLTAGILTIPTLQADTTAAGVMSSLTELPLTNGDFIQLKLNNVTTILGSDWVTFKIIDLVAGELKPVSDSIVSLGTTPTATLNNNWNIGNSTALGESAMITKGNQVMIGSINTDEVALTTKWINFPFSQQFPVTGVGVPNGSIFEGTDGVIYAKGTGGTITSLIPV